MTPTAPVTATVTVAASPQTVYDLVSDLPRMGEWSPENTGGRWVGCGGARVGARFLGTNRAGLRWWPTTTLVTDATPGRRFAFETRLGPLRAAEWAYDITPTDGGCQVTESWTDHRGAAIVAIGKAVTGVTDRVAHTRTMMETTLARLKKTAERTG
ncbi:MAG: SRPBCC family protein [Pseudonocardia sp.]